MGATVERNVGDMGFKSDMSLEERRLRFYKKERRFARIALIGTSCLALGVLGMKIDFTGLPFYLDLLEPDNTIDALGVNVNLSVLKLLVKLLKLLLPFGFTVSLALIPLAFLRISDIRKQSKLDLNERQASFNESSRSFALATLVFGLSFAFGITFQMWFVLFPYSIRRLFVVRREIRALQPLA
ncbi:MAG: hypothetical protein IJM30_08120 [Thermoguttaceae bacterium]|nr:hypothetical protein [Thermoguttaceae bacterium]